MAISHALATLNARTPPAASIPSRRRAYRERFSTGPLAEPAARSALICP